MQKLRTGGEIVLWQTLFLFGVDLLTNVVDYIFHVYLGRALVPGDFAVFQTINSILIVVITAFGVFQPVVARFVAEEAGKQDVQKSIFREYFRLSNVAGWVFAAMVVVARNVLAGWLNVPPLAIVVSAGVVLLSFSRPVVWGMLQGQQKFVAFGITRLVYAISRFAVAIGLIGLGWATMGAVTALPVGTLLSLTIGLVFLGHSLTPKRSLSVSRSLSAPPSPNERGEANNGRGVREGLRLSGYAFVAYAAHTALLNLDMLWVNRFFLPEEAGAYAGAVLLRRILLLLPGVVVVVFYPRVVAVMAQRQLPDKLLAISLGTLGGTVLILTAGYFAVGPWIVDVVFGDEFALAGPLLGWMGVGILGYSVGSIWMNLALATRPGPFVALLVVTVGLQWAGLGWVNGGLSGVVQIFTLAGWGLAAGGAVIYFGWQRPHLLLQFKGEKND
jgi:O-antigen/teichoic acid export membrane protein